MKQIKNGYPSMTKSKVVQCIRQQDKLSYDVLERQFISNSSMYLKMQKCEDKVGSKTVEPDSGDEA